MRLQADFSAVPRPADLSLEAFVDEEGWRAHVFHAFLGKQVHEALARSLGQRVRDRLEVPCRVFVGDLGFVLRTPRGVRPSRAAWLRMFDLPLENDLRRSIAGSELLRRRFRHVARRGLLLPRLEEAPLARAQQEAGALLQRLEAESPGHPLLAETWRECLHDAMDLEGAEEARASVHAGRIGLVLLPARSTPSPLAARLLARAGEGSASERRERLRDAHEAAEDWIALNKP